jgi:hypothetical protein
MLHIRCDSSEDTSLVKMKIGSAVVRRRAGIPEETKRRKKMGVIGVEWEQGVDELSADKDGERKRRDSQRNFVLPHRIVG